MVRRAVTYPNISDSGTMAFTMRAPLRASSIPCTIPRRLFKSPITSPMFSSGVTTSTRMIGSINTGLAWSFKWFNDAIYTVTNSDMKQAEPPASQFQASKPTVTYDDVFLAATQQIKDTDFYNISAPKDSAGIYS